MNETSQQCEAWLVPGSQHLYGEAVLRQVTEHAQQVAAAINVTGHCPVRLVARPAVASAEDILKLGREANAHDDCIGLVCWMHTFSPAQMWTAGLRALEKPLLHLHTQFERDLPWATIDMDYINLNQSAHGGREFGYICTRLNIPRKVVVGHWRDDTVQQEVSAWMRAALGLRELRRLRVLRLGDNMRRVAVTEGDKIEARIQLGIEVLGHGTDELSRWMDEAGDADLDHLLNQYDESYAMVPSLRPTGNRRDSLRYAARMELGLRAMLEHFGATALTDTFEQIAGLRQLPGIAVQRLMADGHGFGAEGDWKTAALVRALKVMSEGLPGGTSFMEDYTYHLDPAGPLVLGAHMLEICPSLTDERPSCEIHPLAIGGREDPVRLVFTASPGPAVNVAMIDLGDRFRMLVSEVETVPPVEPMPKLPVARAVWKPLPDLNTAAAAWIHAGGPHHTVFSQAVTTEMIEDLADMAGIECVTIDHQTRLRQFRRELG